MTKFYQSCIKKRIFLRKNVLVVYDDPAYLKLIAMRLKQKGYEVSTVSSGEEALEAIWQNLPELLLIDEQMPKMKGSEVLEKMAGEDLLKTIPIILMAGRADLPKDIIPSYIRGDLIVKPCDFDELLSKIEQLAA